MCVCVGGGGWMCVCLGGEGSERIWNKCEKGEEGEEHLSVSVMNSLSAFVPLCWPMQGSPTTAYTYRVCMVYDHVYSMLLYEGILHLATKC